MKNRKEQGVRILIAFHASDELIRDVTEVRLSRIREIRRQQRKGEREEEACGMIKKTR